MNRLFKMTSSSGLIILLDLDNFGQIMEDQAWTRYSPNDITGKMTDLIEDFVSQHFATILWGLNRKEGTEECMLLISIPFEESESVLRDLDDLRLIIENEGKKTKTGATLSIGIAAGTLIDYKPAASRKKHHLYNTPLRRLAKRALEDAKKRGGNQLVIHHL